MLAQQDRLLYKKRRMESNSPGLDEGKIAQAHTVRQGLMKGYGNNRNPVAGLQVYCGLARTLDIHVAGYSGIERVQAALP